MIKYFEKIYKEDFNSFCQKIEKSLKENKKEFIVTANPETLMTGNNKGEYNKLLLKKETTIISDGIGVVIGAKLLGIKIKERIPGIEIVEKLLKYGDENKKTAFFFGAKEDVMIRFLEKVEKENSNLEILGYSNGYVEDKDKVMKKIVELEPDIVLIGLGIPKQEILIDKYFSNVNKGIYIGVGGSFDVLSGIKKRAPKIFIKMHCEWLYRLIKEPSRVKRFYNSNIKFLIKVLVLRRKK